MAMIYIVEDDENIREIEMFALKMRAMRCRGLNVRLHFMHG